MYGRVRLQTISDKGAKTNGGEDWVKEREREKGTDGKVEGKKGKESKENEWSPRAKK